MTFRLPTFFSRALQILRGKRLVPTSLNTVGLRGVAAAVKRRAIFSARNTQLSVLQSVADAVSGMLEGRLNLAAARLALAQSLDAAGYQPERGFPGDEEENIPPAERGSLRDLRSDARRDLVIKTQFRLAANEAAHIKATQDEVSLYQYPAYELVRYEGRRVPRGFKRRKDEIVRDPGQDWPSRFAAAGGQIWEGRMIALKGSEVWQALGDGAGGYEDTLGNPWAPFGFGSGWGLREVARDEALRLGVIRDGDEVARVPTQLAADLRRDAADLDPALLEAVGKDLETQEDGSVRMREILEAEVAAAEAAYRANSLRGRLAALACLLNDGTSEGARKGWITRRLNMPPRRISAAEADLILGQGVEVTSAHGDKIRFGARLKRYLDKKPDGVARKEHLMWAMRTVMTGAEKGVRVEAARGGEWRRTYSKLFREKGKEKGFLVVAEIRGNEVFDIYRARAGRVRREHGLKNHRTRERPRAVVHTPDAAAGSRVDCGQSNTLRRRCKLLAGLLEGRSA